MTDPPFEGIEYLCNYSTKDQLWDKHRAVTDTVADYYLSSPWYDQHRKGERTCNCSLLLGFKKAITELDEKPLKLAVLHTCKVRWCSICQWARQRVWRRRFIIGIPKMLEAHPASRLLFLTLTEKNCAIADLRSTLDEMGKSFQRLMKRKELQGLIIGYAKSTEITKGADGSAHPHFHILLLVKSTYFGRGHYLSHQDWMLLWRSAARLDYDPYVHIQTVKPKKGSQDTTGIISAVCEVAKYCVKPSDLTDKDDLAEKGKNVLTGQKLSARDWFLELDRQMHGTKVMNLSGAFRKFMAEEEPQAEEILKAFNDDEDDEIPSIEEDKIFFNWWRDQKRYARKMKYYEIS
jgi:plasmid rolling circle replication initiator protein Rep